VEAAIGLSVGTLNEGGDMDPCDIQPYLARRRELVDQVRGILVEAVQLRLDPERIDPDAALFGTGLALDSIDALELVVALETSFDFQLPDLAAGPNRALRSVNTLVDVLMAGGESSP